MKMILGFLSSIIALLVGNAIILFIVQTLYVYTPYWIASILGMIICLFIGYRVIDISLFNIPYKVVKVRDIWVYRIMTYFVIFTAVLSFVNHEYFEELSPMPKWMYMVLFVCYIAASVSLSRIVRLYLAIFNEEYR